MDYSKIFTFACAILGGISTLIITIDGALSIWDRFKGGESKSLEVAMIPQGERRLSIRQRLNFWAMFALAVSLTGFMISGSFWVNSINNKTIDFKTRLEGLQIRQDNATNSDLEEWLLVASKIEDKYMNYSATNILTSPTSVTMGSLPNSPMTMGYSSGLNMMFVVRIANAGKPTTVWDWTATMVLDDGTTIPGAIPPLQFSTNEVGYLQTAYGLYKPTPECFLVDELASKPLKAGGGINGWFVVHFNGITRLDDGTKIFIQCKDVYHKTLTIHDVWSIPTQPPE